MADVYVPHVTAGGISIDEINAAIDVIQSFLNALPGANLADASVAIAKLANKKALFAIGLRSVPTLAAASVATFDGVILPEVDGVAASTFKYIGCSVFGFAVTGGASNALLIKKAGTTVHTVDISALAAGTPTEFKPAAAVSSSTDDKWTIDYVYGATAGSYAGLNVVLFFTVNHAAQ